MKRILLGLALFTVLAGGAGAAVLASQSVVTATITVPYTVGDQTGEVVVSQDIEVPTVTETVTQTVTETVTVTQPTETTPPDPDPKVVELVDQKWVCDGPVDLDLVKVTINQTATRMDGVQIAAGCTGRIGRLEVDTSNADGIHVGAFAHDLVVEGGYLHVHGRFTEENDVHFDGIQVMGGQRITFQNFEIDDPFASNSALYFNMGAGGQDRPTDVVCDGCTIRRSPEDNRTVRIYTSTRSGVRNSTIYGCGTAEGCGAGAIINIRTDLAVDPVNENNTVIETGPTG